MEAGPVSVVSSIDCILRFDLKPLFDFMLCLDALLNREFTDPYELMLPTESLLTLVALELELSPPALD